MRREDINDDFKLKKTFWSLGLYKSVYCAKRVNPYNAELFFIKHGYQSCCFFQFEIIINVLFSCF